MQTPTTPRVVICMKWGALFSAEYVNVLYNACKRHINGEFRFVCLTDDANGLQADIESYPIPDIGLEERHYYHGCWPKISIFAANLYGLTGRALYIDLDMIILNSLDDFFEISGDLVAIDNATFVTNPRKATAVRTMGGLLAFDLGKLDYVLTELQANRDTFITKYDTDQVYLHHAVKDIRYWKAQWLQSFKYHLRQPILIDRFLPPRKPALETKILVFHGNPRPIDLIRPSNNNWGNFPHYGRGAVDWMVDYWRQNSGSV